MKPPAFVCPAEICLKIAYELAGPFPRTTTQRINGLAEYLKFIVSCCKNWQAEASLVMTERNARHNLQVTAIEETGSAVPGELELAFRTHHALLFRTAYRITGNAADAEDVLQLVFLRLLRRRGAAETLDHMDHEESYLRRAAVNASLDVIRSRKANRTVELPPDLAHNDTPELRQALRRALAQLEPRRAEIFTLRFVEGFTNPQIAKMLGISHVLVAVLVHRTRQQLRQELSRYLRR